MEVGQVRAPQGVGQRALWVLGEGDGSASEGRGGPGWVDSCSLGKGLVLSPEGPALGAMASRPLLSCHRSMGLLTPFSQEGKPDSEMGSDLEATKPSPGRAKLVWPCRLHTPTSYDPRPALLPGTHHSHPKKSQGPHPAQRRAPGRTQDATLAPRPLGGLLFPFALQFYAQGRSPEGRVSPSSSL